LKIVFLLAGLLSMLWIAILYFYGDNNQAITVSIKENLTQEKLPAPIVKEKLPWGKVLREPPFW